MRKFFYILTIFVLFGSCSKQSKNVLLNSFSNDSVVSTKLAKKEKSMAFAESNDLISLENSSNSVDFSENFERKLIKTASISVKVEDLSDCAEKIQSWAKKFEGFINYSNVFENGSSFSVKIPAKNFENAIKNVGDFGKVTSQSISSQDVTEQFYDLQTRLDSKKILQEKYLEYLKSATNIKDLLQIESELNKVTSDLESMQSQMNRLSNKIDYSTINIDFYLPHKNNLDDDIKFPDLKNALTDFVSNILSFLVILVKSVIYFVVFGTPIFLIISLFYWLLFGKIGLIKKFFKKLK